MLSISLGLAGICVLVAALVVAAVWGHGAARQEHCLSEAAIAGGLAGLATGCLLAAGLVW